MYLFPSSGCICWQVFIKSTPYFNSEDTTVCPHFVLYVHVSLEIRALSFSKLPYYLFSNTWLLIRNAISLSDIDFCFLKTVICLSEIIQLNSVLNDQSMFGWRITNTISTSVTKYTENTTGRDFIRKQYLHKALDPAVIVITCHLNISRKLSGEPDWHLKTMWQVKDK